MLAGKVNACAESVGLRGVNRKLGGRLEYEIPGTGSAYSLANGKV